MKKATGNLETMKLNELQARFAEVVGETTRSPNRTYLVRKITEAIAAKAASAEVPESVAEPVATLSDSGADTVPETPATGMPDALAAGSADTTASPNTPAASMEEFAPARERLSKLDVPALQARYREVLGRETTSENRGYLVWKIRAAQKGSVSTGPRKSARSEGATFKVLPLRMEEDLVEQLDAAWRRQGLASRMEMFRVALQTYFAGVGEGNLANRLSARD